jgi:hypothetical protein
MTVHNVSAGQPTSRVLPTAPYLSLSGYVADGGGRV